MKKVLKMQRKTGRKPSPIYDLISMLLSNANAAQSRPVFVPFKRSEITQKGRPGRGSDRLCSREKFLKVRSFPAVLFYLLIAVWWNILSPIILETRLLLSGWMDTWTVSPPWCRIIYPSLGLLSFYTRLYWLTVTRGACQYKITPEEKRSWISFLIGFTLLHGVVWWFMARAYDLRKCNCTVKYRLLYVSCLQFTEIVIKLRPWFKQSGL